MGLAENMLCDAAAAVVSRVKSLPTMTASSSSNTSSTNGAIPNEVVCEEEELDFDRWRVRQRLGPDEHHCWSESAMSFAILHT